MKFVFFYALVGFLLAFTITVFYSGGFPQEAQSCPAQAVNMTDEESGSWILRFVAFTVPVFDKRTGEYFGKLLIMAPSEDEALKGAREYLKAKGRDDLVIFDDLPKERKEPSPDNEPLQILL